MADSKPVPGQAALPGFGPPPAGDRETEVREIVFKILAASRRAKSLREIISSTAWVGVKPVVLHEELETQLHAMVGDGTLTRASGDDLMWTYSLPKAGAT